MNTSQPDTAQAPEVTENQVHARLKWLSLGMVIINHGLLLSTVWGQWWRVGVVTAVFVVVTGLNTLLAQRFFSERTRLAEAVRIALNMMANFAYGHWTDWALPVWLYLPFNSLWGETRRPWPSTT